MRTPRSRGVLITHTDEEESNEEFSEEDGSCSNRSEGSLLKVLKTPGDVFLVELEFNSSREVITSDALTQLNCPRSV